MDEKFRVSEKTKSSFSDAEKTVRNAGSTIMKNRYVLTGASWVTSAFNRVTKATGEVGQKTREKVLAEEEARRAEGKAMLKFMRRNLQELAQTRNVWLFMLKVNTSIP
ncbi:binding partner of ACD11 1-like [Melia azedarach]|uniref:Binding partner of ACD11 1-like n=1 Tax=Melia azedarach TaxID=155640 RepID=A0ACC1YBD5_MELAZ|nr:binding partner of ACD11 1-like [Melia azedarach]